LEVEQIDRRKMHGVQCIVCIADLCTYYEHMRVHGAGETHMHPRCVCQWLFAERLQALSLVGADVTHCATLMPYEYGVWKMHQQRRRLPDSDDASAYTDDEMAVRSSAGHQLSAVDSAVDNTHDFYDEDDDDVSTSGECEYTFVLFTDARRLLTFLQSARDLPPAIRSYFSPRQQNDLRTVLDDGDERAVERAMRGHDATVDIDNYDEPENSTALTNHENTSIHEPSSTPTLAVDREIRLDPSLILKLFHYGRS
jgi:hypothetical protein